MSTHATTSEAPEIEGRKSEWPSTGELFAIAFSQAVKQLEKQLDLPNVIACTATDTTNTGAVVTANLLCGTVSSATCPLHIETSSFIRL